MPTSDHIVAAIPGLSCPTSLVALGAIKILAFTNPKIRCLEMPIYYGERVGESKLNLWRDGFGNLFQLFKLRLTLGQRRRAGATVTPLPLAEEPEKERAQLG